MSARSAKERERGQGCYEKKDRQRGGGWKDRQGGGWRDVMGELEPGKVYGQA